MPNRLPRQVSSSKVRAGMLRTFVTSRLAVALHPMPRVGADLHQPVLDASYVS